MYEITYEQAGIICIGLIMLGAACYGLGYQAADAFAKVAVRQAKSQMARAEKRERDLGQWVRENWPSELAAYEQGTTAGYQRGIDHSADVDAEEDAA